MLKWYYTIVDYIKKIIIKIKEIWDYYLLKLLQFINYLKLKLFSKKIIRISKYSKKFIFKTKIYSKNFLYYIFFKKSMIYMGPNYINYIKIKPKLKNNIINNYLIKFSVSNIIKYLNKFIIKNQEIYFIRKNKIFNKGRYSRNRQYYRTGVYWCLYVNLIAVIGLYFWFYRFNMNFGYVWWLLFIFISSFFLPKILKYRFYNVYKLFINIVNSLIWFFYIIKNLLINLFEKLIFLINYYKIFFLTSMVNKKNFGFFYFKVFSIIWVYLLTIPRILRWIGLHCLKTSKKYLFKRYYFSLTYYGSNYLIKYLHIEESFKQYLDSLIVYWENYEENDEEGEGGF